MTDDEMIKLYEDEIKNDPDAYTREGECVYQITRTELIAAGRALQAATRDATEQVDVMRIALELIAVGDSKTPSATAAHALVATGLWNDQLEGQAATRDAPSADAVDAQRYRWLQQQKSSVWHEVAEMPMNRTSEYIDKAIAASEPKGDGND